MKHFCGRNFQIDFENAQKFKNSRKVEIDRKFIKNLTEINENHQIPLEIPIFAGRNGKFYLKQKLGETVDYIPIPSHVFKRLSEIYGVEDDRRDYILREVIKKNGNLYLEVYPRIIHVSCAFPNFSRTVPFSAFAGP